MFWSLQTASVCPGCHGDRLHPHLRPFSCRCVRSLSTAEADKHTRAMHTVGNEINKARCFTCAGGNNVLTFLSLRLNFRSGNCVKWFCSSRSCQDMFPVHFCLSVGSTLISTHDKHSILCLKRKQGGTQRH